MLAILGDWNYSCEACGMGLHILSLILGTVIADVSQVTKRNGETVSIHMNKTGLDLNKYLWTYGHHSPTNTITIVINGDVIVVNGTRFENRLHTHVETGSITISNLTINDTGVFKAQIITEAGLWQQTFNLIVSDNLLILVHVLVGENVTLDTDIDELQKEHEVKWTRGPTFTGELIARWKNNITTVNHVESFRGVLQLNPHSGSLTIMKVMSNYTGSYCLVILLGRDPHILRRYFVTVFEPVSIPHISTALVNTTDDASCSIDCSVENAADVTLSWYRGEKEIKQVSNPDIFNNLSLRLKINEQNEDIYSCVAANPVSDKAVKVNSTQWCPPVTAPKWWIVGVAVGVVVICSPPIAVAIVICKRRSIKDQGSGDCCRMGNLRQSASEESDEIVERRNLCPNN